MSYTHIQNGKRCTNLEEIRNFYDNFFSTALDLEESAQHKSFIFLLDAFFDELKFIKESEDIWSYGQRKVELIINANMIELEFHSKLEFAGCLSFERKSLSSLCIGSKVLIKAMKNKDGDPYNLELEHLTLREYLNSVMNQIRGLW